MSSSACSRTGGRAEAALKFVFGARRRCDALRDQPACRHMGTARLATMSVQLAATPLARAARLTRLVLAASGADDPGRIRLQALGGAVPLLDAGRLRRGHGGGRRFSRSPRGRSWPLLVRVAPSAWGICPGDRAACNRPCSPPGGGRGRLVERQPAGPRRRAGSSAALPVRLYCGWLIAILAGVTAPSAWRPTARTT